MISHNLSSMLPRFLGACLLGVARFGVGMAEEPPASYAEQIVTNTLSVLGPVMARPFETIRYSQARGKLGFLDLRTVSFAHARAARFCLLPSQ